MELSSLNKEMRGAKSQRKEVCRTDLVAEEEVEFVGRQMYRTRAGR